MKRHVCPWWMAYTFDLPLRRLIHKPRRMFAPYLRPGQTVLDLGCGMGFFTIALAKLLGPEGRVVAVDLQPKMLEVCLKRAARAGVAQRIKFRLARPGRLEVEHKVDWALAFWMVHEVPDPVDLLRQVAALLEPGGVLFMAEPRMHVNQKAFAVLLEQAAQTGFTLQDQPKVSLSRAAVLAAHPAS